MSEFTRLEAKLAAEEKAANQEAIQLYHSSLSNDKLAQPSEHEGTQAQWDNLPDLGQTDKRWLMANPKLGRIATKELPMNVLKFPANKQH